MKVYEGETKLINIEIGILQKLLILLILFLFFVANLLDMINNEALQMLSFVFMDDIYILIHRNSMEYNYRIFERIYKKYEK